jgi:hypothetical protein
MAEMTSRLVIALSALGLMSCAQQFPLPMTAAQLQTYHSGAALVTYLGQPDATPAVCDSSGQGPHLKFITDDVRRSLTEALADGKVAPDIWTRCVDALLRSASPAQRAAFVDEVGRSYKKLIEDSDLEKSSVLQERLRTMQRFYIERQNGQDGHTKVVATLFGELRVALDAHRLGPVATRFGSELLAMYELEHGTWRGRVVDTPMIDGLFAAKDETTLQRFTDRLPASGGLGKEARRRVIRLHIDASPFPEVKTNRVAVEELLINNQAYAIAPAEHPATRGWLVPERIPMRRVVVRQHVWPQTATLLGYGGAEPRISVLPELALRGALMIELSGVSHPVSLCSPPRALDPNPCIVPADVKLEGPTAYLDANGAFHFVDGLPMSEAVRLTRMKDRFTMPIKVDDRLLVTLEWPLRFELPESVVFNDGRRLHVLADHRDPARYVFTVSGSGRSYQAVVEGADLARFRIVSRGVTGAPGSDGSPGSTGSSGGQCQSGGNGGNGGNGGPGGDGGDGGDIDVEVTCGDTSCGDAVRALERSIVSEGGDGGPGGRGGPGGSGGSGGSAGPDQTTTDSDGHTTTIPGCSAGSSGSSGSAGSDGSPGSPGRSGRVIVQARR